MENKSIIILVFVSNSICFRSTFINTKVLFISQVCRQSIVFHNRLLLVTWLIRVTTNLISPDSQCAVVRK